MVDVPHLQGRPSLREMVHSIALDTPVKNDPFINSNVDLFQSLGDLLLKHYVKEGTELQDRTGFFSLRRGQSGSIDLTAIRGKLSVLSRDRDGKETRQVIIKSPFLGWGLPIGLILGELDSERFEKILPDHVWPKVRVEAEGLFKDPDNRTWAVRGNNLILTE